MTDTRTNEEEMRKGPMPRALPNFLSVLREKFPRHITQVTITMAVGLGPFTAGLGKGYTSPALASLQETKQSFQVSTQEGSWIASLSLFGALFGCLMGGLMLQMGRKRTLVMIGLPFSGSWLLTVFANRVEMLYFSSFIGGFLSAITLLAAQVYVTEIAHPEIRGCLSALLKVAGEFGTLVSFSFGAFLDWRQLAAVAAVGPLLFFLAMLSIPETPSFLLICGKDKEAAETLQRLRLNDEDANKEMEILRRNVTVKHKNQAFVIGTSHHHHFPFRQLLITCGLMFFQKFSGVTVFHHYAVPIFKKVFGQSIDPHSAAITMVLLRLCGSMASGFLTDTAGRLPLLILSNIFISGSFFAFGLYSWWLQGSQDNDYVLDAQSIYYSSDWIPLTCVLFFTFFFSVGIGPISWLMVGELFPLEYRNMGGAISTSFSYACAFVAVKTYVDLESSFGLHGTFWIYAIISLLSLFFTCCAVPETKGVKLEEMRQASFSSNDDASSIQYQIAFPSSILISSNNRHNSMDGTESEVETKEFMFPQNDATISTQDKVTPHHNLAFIVYDCTNQIECKDNMTSNAQDPSKTNRDSSRRIVYISPKPIDIQELSSSPRICNNCCNSCCCHQTTVMSNNSCPHQSIPPSCCCCHVNPSLQRH